MSVNTTTNIFDFLWFIISTIKVDFNTADLQIFKSYLILYKKNKFYCIKEYHQIFERENLFKCA